MRGDLVAAIKSIRDSGSTKLAQERADLRIIGLFLKGGRLDETNEDGGRLPYPGMSHYAANGLQQVIGMAGTSDNFKGYSNAQIAALADRITAQENRFFRNYDTLINAGDGFRRMEQALDGVPEDRKVEEAISRGLIKGDSDFGKRLVAAQERLSGQRLRITPNANVEHGLRVDDDTHGIVQGGLRSDASPNRGDLAGLKGQNVVLATGKDTDNVSRRPVAGKPSPSLPLNA
jgi:hypothetical protein